MALRVQLSTSKEKTTTFRLGRLGGSTPLWGHLSLFFTMQQIHWRGPEALCLHMFSGSHSSAFQALTPEFLIQGLSTSTWTAESALCGRQRPGPCNATFPGSSPVNHALIGKKHGVWGRRLDMTNNMVTSASLLVTSALLLVTRRY